MTLYLNEEDVEFLVGAIKLIKENGASNVEKDSGTISGVKLSVYDCGDRIPMVKLEQFEEEAKEE